MIMIELNGVVIVQVEYSQICEKIQQTRDQSQPLNRVLVVQVEYSQICEKIQQTRDHYAQLTADHDRLRVCGLKCSLKCSLNLPSMFPEFALNVP
jgi:hypothetical protein